MFEWRPVNEPHVRPARVSHHNMIKENIEHNSEKFHFNDCLYVTHTAVFHITHKIKWLTAKMNLKSNIKSILFRVYIHV